jgi:hypothetical protein
VLVLALAATLLGFVLLVAALLSGVLWLAIACVVVCVVGVGFLIADLLGLGRKSSAANESDANSDDATGGGSGDAEVGTSDEEQDRDWSAAAEHEEDPVSGDASEDHSHTGETRYDAGADAETSEIPRISEHDRRDDPPTEEMFLHKPR